MCEACSEMIDHNAVSDRAAWLQQRVLDEYVARRPVMGAQDDTTDGHRSAAMGAKLREIGRLLEDARMTHSYSEYTVLKILVDDIQSVIDVLV